MTDSSSRSPDRPVRKPGVPRSRREVVFDAAPPRPMTVLTRALLERKRQASGSMASRIRKATAVESESRCLLCSDDGKVCYLLTEVHGGLQVERTISDRTSLQMSQLLFFAGRQPFDQWCDTDPIRFEQPLLHQQLRQEGLRLLDGRPTAPRTA